MKRTLVDTARAETGRQIVSLDSSWEHVPWEAQLFGCSMHIKE